MISIIPGITETLSYLQPSGGKSEGEVFAQVLASVAGNPPAGSAPSASSPARYVVQPGDNLSRIARKLGYSDPRTLAQANGLKNPDRLQVGQVLYLPENPSAMETGIGNRASPDKIPLPQGVQPRNRSRRLVVASWYGVQHHGRQMANGQPFNMYADTAAHRSLPLGTRLILTNPRTGFSTTVTVTDRGPFVPGRELDLSYEAARKLGMLDKGVAKLYLEEG